VHVFQYETIDEDETNYDMHGGVMKTIRLICDLIDLYQNNDKEQEIGTEVRSPFQH